MEASLRDTRHNLHELERSLRYRAETETIDCRPKKRRYNRRMSNWTGKDEETYLRILDRLTDNAAADLERLRRKIERQDMAIEALRKKYQVNAQRPVFTPLKAAASTGFPASSSVEGMAFLLAAFQAGLLLPVVAETSSCCNSTSSQTIPPTLPPLWRRREVTSPSAPAASSSTKATAPCFPAMTATRSRLNLSPPASRSSTAGVSRSMSWCN